MDACAETRENIVNINTARERGGSDGAGGSAGGSVVPGLTTGTGDFHESLQALAVHALRVTSQNLDVADTIRAGAVEIEGSARTLSLSVGNDVDARSATLRAAQIDKLAAQRVRADVVSASALSAGQLRGTAVARLAGGTADGNSSGIVCRAQAITLDDPAAPPSRRSESAAAAALRRRDAATSAARLPNPDPPGPRPDLPGEVVPIPPRVALFHDFGTGRDGLVVNHLGRYRDGVRIVGDVGIEGALTESAPRADDTDVQPVGVVEAQDAVAALRAVSTPGASPGAVRRLGFLGDEVPAILAQRGGSRLRTMDIVALLTTVVQEQQRRLDERAARLDAG
jgi:hypothetical protein